MLERTEIKIQVYGKEATLRIGPGTAKSIRMAAESGGLSLEDWIQARLPRVPPPEGTNLDDFLLDHVFSMPVMIRRT